MDATTVMLVIRVWIRIILVVMLVISDIVNLLLYNVALNNVRSLM